MPASKRDTIEPTARLRPCLDRLYPPRTAALVHERLRALLDSWSAAHPEAGSAGARPAWDERDVVLITYADQVGCPGSPALRCLEAFLAERFGGVVCGVHLLPFHPSTSDEGFAIADHGRVDPRVGDWEDVARLGRRFRLMVDLVANHVSASHPWFSGWLGDDPAYDGFFIALRSGSGPGSPPDADLSAVVRPRSHPLLTPFDAADGVRWVWTTFGPDQVDLNYATPEILLAVTELLLGYLAVGAQIIRLDAVAYLWKQLGTSCVSLPQTHEVVRLWRAVLDAVAPGTLLITETNLPQAENLSYFGDGSDEAHLVYQFPLPPLVLSAFHRGSAKTLRDWLATLPTPAAGTGFFTFLGSHDGIGLRPAEGLLSEEEIDRLCALVVAHGGGLSSRSTPSGERPYELNSVYADALAAVTGARGAGLVDAVLAAESILLALAGLPGVYVQDLFGGRNDRRAVASGRLRSINRRRFARQQLDAELDDPATFPGQVFGRLRERIALRVREPAFHPAGGQRVLAAPPAVLAVQRSAPDGSSRVLCLVNVSGVAQRYEPAPGDVGEGAGPVVDLCSGEAFPAGSGRLTVPLGAYGVRWLRQPAPPTRR